MKKAYNENWVENLHTQLLTKDWLKEKLITSEQYDIIKKAYPHDFYLPGVFVRIGLFIFAIMGCLFFTGFLSVFFIEGFNKAYVPISVFSSITFFFFLEFLIKDRKLFHSGIDNALLYSAVTALLVPLVILFEDRLEMWQYCLMSLPVLVFAIYRYADVFLTACSFIVLFTLLGNLMITFPLGKALLPFAVMIVAICIYFTIRKVKNIYYQQCRKLIEILALATFYLGGNYYVVREANAELNNIAGAVSPQIAFAALFYIFTAVIPLAYLFFGIKNKSRILLVVGLLCLALSVFTVQYYTGYLTIPQAISLSGIIMIVTASWLIHYLKSVRYGISDHQKSDNQHILQIQSLLAAEYLGSAPQQNNFDFGGGGGFSGGGAGSSF
jgi:hypothetical protein